MAKTQIKTIPVKETPPGKLILADWLKGLLMAVGTPVLVIIQQSIDKGQLTFNWKVLAMTAAGAGLVYILKNLTTSSVTKLK